MVVKKKTIEETYVMLSQHEHILKRPDTYIGSVTRQISSEWVNIYGKIIRKDVNITPGFIKIVDEAITNAIDHSNRDSTVKYIKIDISKESGEIRITNDGIGIPVEVHSLHNMYIPEMIFGNLLTGSNYDDTEERTGAGRNGLGIKVTNIFSKSFKIETVDSINKKKFSQRYSDNMSVKSKPKISETSSKSYTRVTFTPDYEKFDMDGIDDDTYSVLSRRVYECIACTNKNVSVFLNGEKVNGKGLVDYASFFFDKEPIASETQGKWEYLAYQSQGYEQVSFVNGNNTLNGGKHVDYVLSQITTGVKSMIEAKMKIQNVKPATVKDNIFLFVNCTIPNPKFSSQTKDILMTSSKDFGSEVKVSSGFIKKIYNSPVAKEVADVTTFKDRKKLDKDVSSSKKSIIKVKNLEDATNAGTTKSQLCSLILTEGLSASSFAVSGLSVVGRANYGIFSLKGKVLNVREATQAQLLKNEEILAIKKIMGLHTSKDYTTEQDIASLRYGSITILADSDVDGIHISSLIMNFIHFWWPALMKRDGFIKTIKTPIVKATKGGKVINFYSESDYYEFLKTKTGNWTSKYYKGLGTSTAKEAKETFKDLKTNMEFFIEDSDIDKSFGLAFDKKKADDRKKWLQHVPDVHADRNNKNQVTFSDFINKELIHFSNYDNVRSIPHIMDGLKPSQRKVLYTAFKRNLYKEMKVAQFGAAVAEETSYHHGEVSLSMTIVGMAQNYTGSNNINLLEPCGNFGFRNHNGKDAASPRYIFTHLTTEARQLFSKDDEDILEYNVDDGTKIEPKFYVPSLPLVLVNGSIGIGTGYSTNIPSFKPDDIILNMKLLMENKEPIKLVPWYSGYRGTIEEDGNTSFIMKGVFSRVGKNSLNITEIPINCSISDYKEFLESHEEFSTISTSTENDANFTIKFKDPEEIKNFDHKRLKLLTKINLTNMHLFDAGSKIKKYDDPNDIIRDFLECKLEYNKKRREHMIGVYTDELVYLNNKKRFLEDIMEGRIDIYRKTKVVVEGILSKSKYSQVDGTYSYLTNLPISSFTDEQLYKLSVKIQQTVDCLSHIKLMTPEKILLTDLGNLKR